jgi:RimJ/RimL family protein N-acetyltransferase
MSILHDTPHRDLPMRLHTDRLLIRAVSAEDGLMLYEGVRESFAELTRWMPWAKQMPARYEQETYAREAAARFRQREELQYVLLLRDGETFVGGIGFHAIHWHVPRLEIGYWLRTSMTGKGYMTEAVTALTAFGFRTLHAERLEIRCDARNIASASVARRAGYALEARLHHNARGNDGLLTDTLVFARLKDAAANPG